MPGKIAHLGALFCDGERELGVEKAPGTLREAGLLPELRNVAEVRDLEDIPLETPVHDKISRRVRNVGHVMDGCRTVFRAVSKAVREGYFPLVIRRGTGEA